MRAYVVVLILILAIFGSIGGALYLRISALAAMDRTPPPVTIAMSVAAEETWEEYLDAVGTIRAVRGVELTSESSGEITALHFDSGDQVAAGKLLVVLNDEVERASRQNQIATLELAKILFKRDSRLIQQKSISQTQFDRSKADLERAQAQLAETEARLRNKRISAPFAGTLGIRRVELGDYVSPATVIATLQDLSQLEIDFTVPAQFAPRLKPGLSMTLEVPAFPGKRYDATLTAIDARVDPGTRNLLLRAAIAEPYGLLPGMFANLSLSLGEPVTVVTVPETAVTYSLHGDTVYVVEPTESGDLTAISRVVKLGEVRSGRIAIQTGLKAGERVVTAGQNKLYRGVRVLVDDSVAL